MRVWVTTDFEGHYPVGTAGIVVAEDEARARRLMRDEIKRQGLSGKGFGKPFSLQEIPLTNARATVLLNGDY
jgi:hypothetical protein